MNPVVIDTNCLLQIISHGSPCSQGDKRPPVRCEVMKERGDITFWEEKM